MRTWINLFENDQSGGPASLQDVAAHFLSTRDDLLDDDEDYADFRDMDDKTALEIIKREFVSGTCGAFAIALHDKTGYPIVGLNGGMHIAVQTPDGSIIDFLGKNPLLKVLKRYGMKPNTPVKQWSREEAVEHVLMGGPEDEWDDITVAKWVMNKLGKW